MIKFTLVEGVHSLACGRCGSMTEVQVYPETGTWRVKTSPVQGTGKSKPPAR
jgi:hypothetical protein